MRRIFPIFLLILASCTDGGLPGNPVFSRFESSGMGDSLRIFWNSIEGVDYYRVLLDGEPYWEGSDTAVTVPYFETLTLVARGLGDETSVQKSSSDFLYMDTIFVRPQEEAIILTSTLAGKGLTIKSISDTVSRQYFFVFLAKNTDSLGSGISEGDIDSLKLYSSSSYFNEETSHKVDYLLEKPIVNLPLLDSVEFHMDSTYVLWYSPDTLGWDGKDYFFLLRADSVEVDSLGNVKLRLIYTVDNVGGLRWF